MVEKVPDPTEVRALTLLADLAFEDGCASNTRDDIVRHPTMTKVKASVAARAMLALASATEAPPVAEMGEGPLPLYAEKVTLTSPQLSATIDALNFVLAGDWDDSSHDHAPEVYDRALSRLQDLNGRVVSSSLRPAFEELKATYAGVDRLARRYEYDIAELKAQLAALTKPTPPASISGEVTQATGVTHNIKCWPGVFEEMRSGRKVAEFRRNDRDYKAGDDLLIREWCPEASAYTHREITRRITHVLMQGFGMPAGYAMLSLAAAPEAATPSAVGGVDRMREAVINEAAKPWADYHGDLPDYDHPLRCVFESGVQYTVELLAKELKVEDWQNCDGTEEYDGDLGGTLMNIVMAALPTDEHGDHYRPSEIAGLIALATGETSPEKGALKGAPLLRDCQSRLREIMAEIDAYYEDQIVTHDIRNAIDTLETEIAAFRAEAIDYDRDGPR